MMDIATSPTAKLTSIIAKTVVSNAAALGSGFQGADGMLMATHELLAMMKNNAKIPNTAPAMAATTAFRRGGPVFWNLRRDY